MAYNLLASLWTSGLPLPGADDGKSISIVCAHGVHTPEMEKMAPPPTSSVSAESFEANIKALQHHYSVISLSDAVEMLAGRKPLKPRCAVLTFDDSLLCTAKIAFPILKSLGATATVFLSTDAIDTGAPYWWLRLDYAWRTAKVQKISVLLPTGESVRVSRGDTDSVRDLKRHLRQLPAAQRDAAIQSAEEKFAAKLEDSKSQYPYAVNMTWDDVRGVLAAGFDVGSHTVSHANLAKSEPVEVRHELVASKALIEKHTGAPCRHFCYPYGSFTANVAEAVAKAGFDAATTTVAPGRNRKSENYFTLRRYGMPSRKNKLPCLLSGAPK